MKKIKKVFLVLTAVMVLTIPTSVFAATSDSEVTTSFRGYCGIGLYASTLTDEQKNDLDVYYNQMTELKKESINNMVQNGLLTQEQGEDEIARLDEMAKYHEEYGYGIGMMNGTGYGIHQGTIDNATRGRGMRGYY